jgi:hypothetical protein
VGGIVPVSGCCGVTGVSPGAEVVGFPGPAIVGSCPIDPLGGESVLGNCGDDSGPGDFELPWPVEQMGFNLDLCFDFPF